MKELTREEMLKVEGGSATSDMNFLGAGILAAELLGPVGGLVVGAAAIVYNHAHDDDKSTTKTETKTETKSTGEKKDDDDDDEKKDGMIDLSSKPWGGILGTNGMPVYMTNGGGHFGR